jgi:putative peptidoglycan lipid II flippase
MSDPKADEPPPPRPPRLARAAGMISLATMLSRVLGLVREQLFAALLGASMFADAFIVAFRIPNLLRDLFAEGALAQAFVPTFKSTLKRDGRNAAYRLADRVAGTLFVVIGIIVLVAGVLAPTIVGALAGDYAEEPGKFELTVELTRIMLPFLPIISLAAVAMGMLNAQDRYGAPALAPAVFNTVSIAVGTGLWLAGVSGQWVAIGWSIGTVLGGLSQLGVQVPTLWRLGYRPRPGTDVRLRDPGVRRVGSLMLPAIGGLAAVQVNIVVNTFFAAKDPGAVAWLNYAFRFLQLPIGVFGVAIATVTTTRFADAAADDDRERMSAQLTEGLRLVAFLTVPATVGLLLLGEPIIRLIFERGAFTPADTLATARALELFAVGLVAYSAVKVAAPAFYAVDRARIPMIASMCAVAGNLAISISLHPVYGYRILALGIAVAATLNFTVLYAMFSARIARVRHLRLLGHLLRIGAASAVMGAAVWGSYRALADLLGEDGLGPRAAVVFLPIGAGVLTYALACRLLRVDELAHYTGRLRRR